MSRTIAFRTATQAAIFELELKGQLSDGHWENDARSCWQIWCNTDVIVDPVYPGRDFHVDRTNFAFDSPKLTKIIGDRMRLYAVLTRAGYTQEQVTLLEKAFEFCSCIPRAEPANYLGDYWTAICKELSSFDLLLVYAQVHNGLAVYGKKELLADLREIKAACKIQMEA